MIASSEESTIAARYSGDNAVACLACSGASVFTNRSVPGTSSRHDGAASQSNLTVSPCGTAVGFARNEGEEALARQDLTSQLLADRRGRWPRSAQSTSSSVFADERRERRPALERRLPAGRSRVKARSADGVAGTRGRPHLHLRRVGRIRPPRARHTYRRRSATPCAGAVADQ